MLEALIFVYCYIIWIITGQIMHEATEIFLTGVLYLNIGISHVFLIIIPYHTKIGSLGEGGDLNFKHVFLVRFFTSEYQCIGNSVFQRYMLM